MTEIDRSSWGRQIPMSDQADVLKALEGGRADWRMVHVLATVHAESAGYEWARPIVVKDDTDHPAHLSVDRGLCQFNSHYFAVVLDRVAYDWPRALESMWRYVVGMSDEWDVRPVLDRIWNAYGTDRYREAVGSAREALGL